MRKVTLFVFMAVCLILSIPVTAEPNPKKYDVFLEAEHYAATNGFAKDSRDRTPSGETVANLWKLSEPEEEGYWAKWEFDIASTGSYWLVIWLQDITKNITSPFWIQVDDQGWIHCTKNTIQKFEGAYTMDMAGYIIDQFPLKAGKHTLRLKVDERRGYKDQAYNLIFDCLAFTKKKP